VNLSKQVSKVASALKKHFVHIIKAALLHYFKAVTHQAEVKELAAHKKLLCCRLASAVPGTNSCKEYS